MATDDIVYRIPVHSHVKKYLASKCEITPFKVTTHNEYGTVLFLSLDRKAEITPEKRLFYNDSMQIRIPKWYVDQEGPHIKNKNIELFNVTIERLMMAELKTMLDMGNHRKGDIKRIIDQFRERYGIFDTELEYHNLRRQYCRKRVQEKKINKIKNIYPGLGLIKTAV